MPTVALSPTNPRSRILATYPVRSDGDLRVVTCLAHAGAAIDMVFDKQVWEAIAREIADARSCGGHPLTERLKEIAQAFVAAGPFHRGGGHMFLSTYQLTASEYRQVLARVAAIRQRRWRGTDE